MSGKILRLKRIMASSEGRMVIFPLDHGVTCGPVAGLERVGGVIGMGIRAGADALVVHKGLMRFFEPAREKLPGIFMHLSGSTLLGPSPHRKVIVGTVEEAIRRGADGVSMHINLGDEHEPEMLRDLGALGDSCSKWQMPLLVMVYIRGTHAPSPVPDFAIAHAARVAVELGADIVKIPFTRDEDALGKIAASVPVPVVVAGGSRVRETGELLARIERALESGIRGVSVGRNVFQHEKPEALLRAICSIAHDRIPADEAWRQSLSEEASPH